MDENLIEQFFDLPSKSSSSPSLVYDKLPDNIIFNNDQIGGIFNYEIDLKIREFLDVESPDYLVEESEDLKDFYSDDFVLQEATKEFNLNNLEELENIDFEYDDRYYEDNGEIDDDEEDDDDVWEEMDEEEEEYIYHEDYIESELYKDILDDDTLTDIDYIWSQLPWDSDFSIDPDSDVFNMFVDLFYTRWVNADGWDTVFSQEYHDEIRYMEERINFYNYHNDFVDVNFFSLENFIKVFYDFLYLSYDVLDDGFRYFVMPYYHDILKEYHDTVFDYTNLNTKKPIDLAHEALKLEDDTYVFTQKDLDLFNSTPWEKVNEVLSDDKWTVLYNVSSEEEYKLIQSLTSSEQLLYLNNLILNPNFRYFADPYDESWYDEASTVNPDSIVFSQLDNKEHFFTFDDLFVIDDDSLFFYDKSDFGLYTNMFRLKSNFDDLFDSFVLSQIYNKEYFLDGSWFWYDFYVYSFFIFFAIFSIFLFFNNYFGTSFFATLTLSSGVVIMFIYNEYSFNVHLQDLIYQNNYSWYWLNFVFLEDLIINRNLYDFFYLILSNAFKYYFYYFFFIGFLFDGLDDLDELLEEVYNIDEKEDNLKKFEKFVDMNLSGNDNDIIFDDEGTFKISTLNEIYLKGGNSTPIAGVLLNWDHSPQEFYEIYLYEKEMEEKMVSIEDFNLAELLDKDNPTDFKNFLQFLSNESELLYVGAILFYLAWRL